MSYFIRNETGRLVAMISNDVAQKIIADFPGEFVRHQVAGQTTKTAFIIAESGSYGVPGFELCIYKGYKLIPELS